MKRFDRIVAQRTAERRLKAGAASRAALERLSALGYDVRIIGSLATGRFMAHSDVDFLIRSPVSPLARAEIERAVTSAFAGTDIPFDLVHKCDLVPQQAEAFENGTFQ